MAIEKILGGSSSIKDTIGTGFNKVNNAFDEIITSSTYNNISGLLSLRQFGGNSIDTIIEPLSGGTTYVSAVTITHSELLSGYTANTLTSTYYLIEDFKTIHRIPNTNEIHTGETEPLIVQVTSPRDSTATTISSIAYSQLYPNDIILYDIENVLAEDGVTPRLGKITYRKDSKHNLSTYYDFRNVKFRRWPIDTSSNNFSASTSYSANQIIISSNGVFRVVSNYTSSSSLNTDESNGKVQRIINFFSFFNYGLSTTFSLNGLSIPVVSSGATDYYTFKSGQTFNNINIGAMDNNDPYNNIIFEGSCENIRIGDNVYDCTFGSGGSSKISIEDECYGHMIESSSNIYFGDGSHENFIYAIFTETIFDKFSYQNSVMNGSNNNFIGKSSYRNYITNSSSDNVIGDKSYNNFISQGSSFNSVGDNSHTNFISQGSGFNDIDVFCNNLTLTSNSSFNMFKQKVKNCTFGASQYNVIGENSSAINFDNSSNNVNGYKCDNITVTNNSLKNTIGNNSTNITIILSDENSIGDNCNLITINSSDNNIVFSKANNIGISGNSQFNQIGNGCSNVTINDTSLKNSVGNACNNIIFSSSSDNNSLGNNCNTVTFFNSDSNSLGNTITNSVFNVANNNSIGNDCNDIILDRTEPSFSLPSLSNNKVGNFCDSISLFTNHSEIGNNCNSIVISGNSSGSFSNFYLTNGVSNKIFTTFANVNNLKWDYSDVTTATITATSLSNKTVNFLSGGTYQYIDNVGGVPAFVNV